MGVSGAAIMVLLTCKRITILGACFIVSTLLRKHRFHEGRPYLSSGFCEIFMCMFGFIQVIYQLTVASFRRNYWPIKHYRQCKATHINGGHQYLLLLKVNAIRMLVIPEIFGMFH